MGTIGHLVKQFTHLNSGSRFGIRFFPKPCPFSYTFILDMVYSFRVREINVWGNRMGFCGETQTLVSAPSKPREICHLQWMSGSFRWCHQRWKLFQLSHVGGRSAVPREKASMLAPTETESPRNRKMFCLCQQKLEAVPLWFCLPGGRPFLPCPAPAELGTSAFLPQLLKKNRVMRHAQFNCWPSLPLRPSAS